MLGLFLATLPAPARGEGRDVVFLEFEPRVEEDAGLALLLQDAIVPVLADELGDAVALPDDARLLVGFREQPCADDPTCIQTVARSFDAPLVAAVELGGASMGFAAELRWLAGSDGSVLETEEIDLTAGEAALTAALLEGAERLVPVARAHQPMASGLEEEDAEADEEPLPDVDREAVDRALEEAAEVIERARERSEGMREPDLEGGERRDPVEGQGESAEEGRDEVATDPDDSDPDDEDWEEVDLEAALADERRVREEALASQQGMTWREAEEQGLSLLEYRRLQRSGLSLEEWRPRRLVHDAALHLRVSVGAAWGAINLARASVLYQEQGNFISQTYEWERIVPGGPGPVFTLGVGYAFHPRVEVAVEGGAVIGRRFERLDTIVDAGEDLGGAWGEVGGGILLLEAKVRFFLAERHLVKPYLGVTLPVAVMSAFTEAGDHAERPPVAQLGIGGVAGIQFDFSPLTGLYLELPVHAVYYSDHGNFLRDAGDDRLTEEEKLPPPEMARFWFRVQVGTQLRF